MKVKPLYIYLGSFIIIITAIIIFDSPNETNSSKQISNSETAIPNDEIHQNLGNAPGSGNVSSEFKQKMEKLKSAYEINPMDTSNAIEYARLLSAAHRPDEAIEVYHELLKSYSNKNELRLELATIYYNIQKYEEAKKEILYVFENEPNASDVQYNLGVVELALGNREKAKEIWESVVRKYPGSESATFANRSLEQLN